MRSTDFGDDKDRVLIRADGEPTYLAADVAYHWDKLERGFELLIDVLGADHHGYAPRLKAVIAALGADPDVLEALIMQPRPHRRRRASGRRCRSAAASSSRSTSWSTRSASTRPAGSCSGAATTPRSTSTSSWPGASRATTPSTTSSTRTPGSRASSARPRTRARRRRTPPPTSPGHAARAGREGDLIKRLLEFPDEVREAAARRAPHRICTYSTAVAADFHAFYRDCQVVGAEGEGVERARLALCLLTMRTIAGSLGLLGISAPERM